MACFRIGNRRRARSPLRAAASQDGMGLIETLMAASLLAIVFAGSMSLLMAHRIQSRKAMEQAIMLDFSQHYLEIARSAEYNTIAPGNPISPLFDGAGGALDIRFPADAEWQTIVGTDMESFHPDLVWLENRSPGYRCVITNQVSGGATRSKHLLFETRWHPPLQSAGRWQTLRLDTVVYEDVY